MSSCAVSATMEETADGERIKPTPCSIAGLATFMDVADSGHPWRSVLRLLPHSLFFVDDSVLEVCPLVEKGKRSKRPGSLLEVLSHEWCKSRGVVREDILLALWERMHWIVESSVNIWLAEAFRASERTRRIDNEFTALWKSLEDYLLGRKQRSDLLRLTVKVLGDAVVGAANHKIDGLSAPLVDTEVCFDPAIPLCPPVNLPWFPRTADWICGGSPRLAATRTTPSSGCTIPNPRCSSRECAESEMIAACVEDERLSPSPSRQHFTRTPQLQLIAQARSSSARRISSIRLRTLFADQVAGSFVEPQGVILPTVLVGGFLYIVVCILPLQFLQLISN
ncbi:unnamed protein product [Phytophthora fragariaefolia]|uniref:Unnamed protein product n=1 Tax=Phytophthora fragariaefolia TaxID=1490495 RepID=A0A9W6Y9A5_9STRA|nr:unnamed protein product [Phytophthora fragariaefolia]